MTSMDSTASSDSVRGEIESSTSSIFRTVKIETTTIDYRVSDDAPSVEIISLRTPVRHRNKGSARKAMSMLLGEIDRHGMAATLAASSLDRRTRQHRLVSFYQSLGFELTGTSINMAGDPVMHRAAAQPTWMGEVLQRSTARHELAETIAKQGKPVRMYRQDGQSALAGADMSGGGKFRLTRFDARGPIGHSEYHSLTEAILDGLREGYSVLAVNTWKR